MCRVSRAGKWCFMHGETLCLAQPGAGGDTASIDETIADASEGGGGGGGGGGGVRAPG